METVTVGCGSGASASRREKAIAVAREPAVEYLCCDRLAERTLANAAANMLAEPDRGYNPSLERWFRAVLPECVENGVRIIGSFGAANTSVASEQVIRIAEELGYDLNVATVLGDDVLDAVLEESVDLSHWQTGEPIDYDRRNIVDPSAPPLFAHAYLGADPIVEALDRRADIVITGRVADLSLFLAPLIYEFGWCNGDIDEIAGGATVGHLLECEAYATGGNLYEPGHVDIPEMDDIGFPIAEVGPSGEAVLTKPDGTGGIVSEFSLKNQLCHEILDPTAYESPDVTLDVTEVELDGIAEDQVHVSGAQGSPSPEDLKLLVGFDNGLFVEAGGSWAGPNSYEKAETCIERVIRPNVDRWEHSDQIFHGPRYDIVGVNSIHGPAVTTPDCDPNEAMVRVAAKIETEAAADDFADLVGNCVGMGGGAGAGGLVKQVRPNITIFPATIPRSHVDQSVELHRIVPRRTDS